MIAGVSYYLSQHPSIVAFRWSHTQSWGSTWSFLVTSIAFYLIVSVMTHLFLCLLVRRGKPVSLGPIPALHSLMMSVVSALIFAGILLSTAAEIKETRCIGYFIHHPRLLRRVRVPVLDGDRAEKCLFPFCP
ncbi:hypothetical protein Gogos_018837 [Gossypium gossypioides]|uniref:Uncharacterized protein n=1 Tax=Gossypium gossypioides TaxID=34282 RepID=A0A7J9BFK8_GOSGO|nr:hypothetical protein [Gossypium gossypioides]